MFFFGFPCGRGGRGRQVSTDNEGVENLYAVFPRAGCIRARRAAARGADIHAPFRIQSLVLPDALAGRDVLAKSPTGSGKTLAFALPLVERLDASEKRPSALVLVPTRELAAQVAAELGTIAPARDLRVAAVYGGVPIGAQAKASRDAHILVATPGRLQDLIERRLVSLDGVRMLVLDEADRMLDMGFQPQVDRSSPGCRRTARRCSSPRRSTARSASSRARTRRTRPASRPQLTLDQEQGEIDHRFVPVTADNKVETLAGCSRRSAGSRSSSSAPSAAPTGSCRSSRGTTCTAAAMHGDMNQNQRERALKRFETGEVSTLVATDVAARGLDLDDITHVINFDPPEDHTGYVHRVGRTGRAGRDGTGVTLVLPEQQADVSRVARMLGHTRAVRERGHEGRPAAARLRLEAAQLEVGPDPDPPQDLASSSVFLGFTPARRPTRARAGVLE